MKIKLIELGREDLLDKTITFEKLSVFDFKNSILSRYHIHKAEQIIFIDDDQKIKVLKDRYSVWQQTKIENYNQ